MDPIVESLVDSFRHGRAWQPENHKQLNLNWSRDNRIRKLDESKGSVPRELAVIKADQVRAALIRSFENKVEAEIRHWFNGVHIQGDLDLRQFRTDGWLSFKNCIFTGNLILKHAQLGVFYLRNTFFDFSSSDPVSGEKADCIFGISAAGLRVAGGLRVGDVGHPVELGFLDLRAASIGGDAAIEACVLNPKKLLAPDLKQRTQTYLGASKDATETDETADRPSQNSSTPYGSRDGTALFAARAHFQKSLRICSSLIYGEVRLSDARIDKSLQIEGTVISNPENLLPRHKSSDGKYSDGRVSLISKKTIPGQSEDELNSRQGWGGAGYSVVADRVVIGGRFSTSRGLSYVHAKDCQDDASGEASNFDRVPSIFLGKMRLHGANIKGAFFLTEAIISSNRRSAISFTGATIHGSVSFSHSVVVPSEDKFGITCRRTKVSGDFFLHDEETPSSARSPWAELEKIMHAVDADNVDEDYFFGINPAEIPGAIDFIRLVLWYRGERESWKPHLFAERGSRPKAVLSKRTPSQEEMLDELARRSWFPGGI